MTANPSYQIRANRLQLLKALMLDQLPGESAFLSHVSWAEYDQLCRFRDQERKGVRLTFDSGDLEFMTVSYTHERYKSILSSLIIMACMATKQQYTTAGNLTIRREDLEKGFEPDTSYFIKNVAQVVTPRVLDFTVDAAPDLAVEVELTNSMIGKLPLYAELGIPEVWRTTGEKVTIFQLVESRSYANAAFSLAFPNVSVEELTRFFLRGFVTDELTLSLEWLEYLRAKNS
jgi:Uma2 family endonuclease